jgi:hypothetical protein
MATPCNFRVAAKCVQLGTPAAEASAVSFDDDDAASAVPLCVAVASRGTVSLLGLKVSPNITGDPIAALSRQLRASCVLQLCSVE